MTDRNTFLQQAKTYIGMNGNDVCNDKLHLGFVDHWCAFAVSAIMQDCGFVGKYISQIEGGAGSIPRAGDGVFGTWFKNGAMSPQAGDLFFLRYADYPYQDKYFCDHVGIVETVDGSTVTTLEGNVDGQNGNWAKTSVFKRKTRPLSSIYAFYRPRWKKMEIYQLTSSCAVNETVRVTATDGLNIRQGASTSYQKLGCIPYDTVVTVTRQTAGGGYTWGLTEYNGITGWIALDYTRKAVPFKQGDLVSLTKNATVYGTSCMLDSWAYHARFRILELCGSRAVIGMNGQVTAAVDTKYLQIIG